jgi:histidinol-phosphate aminotransferase
MELALKFPHVIVSRTFSKSCSLCFQRVGYFVGHPELIGALHRIRDSYNVNGLGQVAALATLGDIVYCRENIRRIIGTRTRLAAALGAEGFEVLPSEANFLLARPPRLPAHDWLEALRERRILVRWFDQPKIRQYLRITIGSDAEVDALLRAVRGINRQAGLE